MAAVLPTFAVPAASAPAADSSFAPVDLHESAARPQLEKLFSGPRSDAPDAAAASVPQFTAVNAEGFLTTAQLIDADIQEVQQALSRLQNAVDESRTLTTAAAVQDLSAAMRKELEGAVLLVRRGISAQVAAMQQETAESVGVPGCGVGTPTFHMRQTVAQALRNKLQRRRENVLALESRLNMGIRETARRRYTEKIGSAPSDDLVDRLCSPAPLECKLGTLAVRREPQVDRNMAELLKEMEARTHLAVDAGKKLAQLEHELALVVESLEQEEVAYGFELRRETSGRRMLVAGLLLGALILLLLVVVLPAVLAYSS